MNKPRLIMLYGFAGVGKTTLAKKLHAEMPFSLYVEADDLLNTIGQWRVDENKARAYVFALTKAMTETYLHARHNVIIPYLLTDNRQAIELESIALKSQADFIELYIKVNKDDATSYLLERGSWGEDDTSHITEADRGHIEQIYEDMERAMGQREQCTIIPYVRNNATQTYRLIKQCLGSK